MNFSQDALRGAEIWHIWKQHHVVECFWKIMKSIFQIRSMHSKVTAVHRVADQSVRLSLGAAFASPGCFSKLTITEIMRKLRREEDLRDFLATHFHAPFSIA